MKDKFMSWEEAVKWLRSQPEQRDLIRACYYDDPLQKSAERFYVSTEWRAVQEILGGGKRGKALDVGAGRGISSYALARDGWQVTALEPDSSPIVGSGAIKQLSQDGFDIMVVEEYGETLPFADNNFELVYGRAVLHHADNFKKFCMEMVRVLKPGGLFLATREHVISRKSDLQTFLDSHPLHSLYGGENAFLLGEYVKALKEAGLEIKQILAPYDSDINLFPSNKKELREKISHKVGFASPEWLVKRVGVPLLNKINKTPGRLFSFVGMKS